MRGLLRLLILLGALVMASDALACTIMPLEPEDERRLELKWQQDVRAASDAVFLARARPAFVRGGTFLDPVLSVSGVKPPTRMLAPFETSTCGPAKAPPSGVVVVFARRIGMRDAPWKFWTWGRWRIVDHLSPRLVLDPELAVAIREAAHRPKAS